MTLPETSPLWKSEAVVAVGPGGVESRPDPVSVEEPMEVRVLQEVDGRAERHSISVTMRTPGHDFELAAGFLFTEGIVPDRAAIVSIDYGTAPSPLASQNVVNVTVSPGTPFDPARMTRNVYTTSSCGVCGKTSLELIQATGASRPRGEFTLAPSLLLRLPEALVQGQTAFARTGGLHAAALFDTRGNLRLLREDVGRHNAVDKVVGSLLLEDALPASDTMLLVSGRASFELVQKALVAGIPLLAAVGAPSTLAVEVARTFGMTLVGFLRDGRFNLYAGVERVTLAPRG